MSEEKRNPNVVHLSAHGAADPRGGELLDGIRKIAVEHFGTLAGKLFENVDDALFDLAEKAESNAVQTRYFDGMREVRRKRQLIERLFVDNMRAGLKAFAAGKLAAPSMTGNGARAAQDDELGLVDETELEESLAIASMRSKAENRHARTLYALNQRLSVISGGRKVEDGSNPLGPLCTCDCFRRAMQELDADINVKLIIYKLFERYVMTGLEPLYDEVNETLVHAGVLPQLHRRLRRRTDAAGGATAERGPATSLDEDAEIDDLRDETLREQLYLSINELLSRRRAVRPGAQHATGAVLDVPELLAALALLQQQAPPPLPPDPQPAANAREEADALAALKVELQEQIARVSEAGKARVSGPDEDTIDLVGMLFEFILEDRNLPAQMQALLSRLQIPYLKVALLDKRLFAKHTHPARRLLDRLADAAKSWSKDSDADLRLYNEIKSIVEALLEDFGDDLDIFDRLRTRFTSFMEQHVERAERVEKRTTDSIRGKEKLQTARRTAARAVLSRTSNTDIPDLVRNILTRPWANYLVLTLLRQGEDSAEWRSAVRFIDDLVASARKPAHDAERKAIRAMLPGIEKTLRHGLATVAFSDSDVRRLMQALGHFYLTQLGGMPPGASTARPEPAAEVEAVIPETMEPIAAPPEPPTPPPPPPGSAPLPGQERAKALQLGNWVEFVADTGQRSRAKLSWISPISGKYLFVNRRGLKVCDMTLQALAGSIHDGSTVVLEEVPLFDRALDAIVERLKQDHGSKGAAGPDAAPGDAQPAGLPPSGTP